MTAQQKFSRLVDWLYRFDDIAVAFSGGAKSALLVCAASEAHGKDTLVLTANTAFFTREELYCVHEVLDDYKLKDARIPVYLLEDGDICANTDLRCGRCKEAWCKKLAEAARGMGCSVLADGVAADELGDPCAQTELTHGLGIVSPFVELGYTREDICGMLDAIGRGYYRKEPHRCLAWQIAPGEEISAEKLDFIEEAEKLVRGIAGNVCRVYLNDGNILVFSKQEISCEKQDVISSRLAGMGAPLVLFYTGLPDMK